jgi:dihydrofolate reductase
MKSTIHIATSLDGFIADAHGSITWLESLASDPKVSERVLAFIQSADVIVMGRLTYEHVLSFGEWPHPDKHTIVVSSQLTAPRSPDTVVVPAHGLLQALVACKAETVWLVGGGQLNAYVLENRMVDEIVVTIAPIVLGSGRPLTTVLPYNIPLQLESVVQLPCSFVELTYTLPRPC